MAQQARMRRTKAIVNARIVEFAMDWLALWMQRLNYSNRADSELETVVSIWQSNMLPTSDGSQSTKTGCR